MPGQKYKSWHVCESQIILKYLQQIHPFVDVFLCVFSTYYCLELGVLNLIQKGHVWVQIFVFAEPYITQLNYYLIRVLNWDLDKKSRIKC